MSLPTRWTMLIEFFETLIEPLLQLEHPGHLALEANGPDGGRWTDLRPRFINLAAGSPARSLARVVARMCGATGTSPDPGPECQQRRGIYYAPCALLGEKRDDQHAHAVAAIVLDIDDRCHGSRSDTMRALGRAPCPTYIVHSGGGVQAGYVLREGLLLDRSAPDSLAASVRAYLQSALALQTLTGADATAWPSHLFRCPGAYHLKDPSRPVLVTVDLEPKRRFNLEDFEDYCELVNPTTLDAACASLCARLAGTERAPVLAPAPLGASSTGDAGRRIVLPRRVSAGIVRMLNGQGHPKYLRPDGTLDRSRATYAAALSLLAAGIERERVFALLLVSALHSAADDRGAYGGRWLAHQVSAAWEYLESRGEGADR